MSLNQRILAKGYPGGRGTLVTGEGNWLPNAWATLHGEESSGEVGSVDKERQGGAVIVIVGFCYCIVYHIYTEVDGVRTRGC